MWEEARVSDTLVERLRNWEHVYPEDEDKPEGSLYLEAADRIEELEEVLAGVIGLLILWQRTGCPHCGGDCSSANPPIDSCIMRLTNDTIEALKGMNDDLK